MSFTFLCCRILVSMKLQNSMFSFSEIYYPQNMTKIEVEELHKLISVKLFDRRRKGSTDNKM